MGPRGAHESGHPHSRMLGGGVVGGWRGRWVHGIGRSHARAGRFREAHAQADLLEKMIGNAGAKGDPYRPSLHYMRGYILLEERQYGRALNELRQANHGSHEQHRLRGRPGGVPQAGRSRTSPESFLRHSPLNRHRHTLGEDFSERE